MQLSPRPEAELLALEGGRIAYDDTGGDGLLVLALPGMGDLRSKYRFQQEPLQQAGYRFVTMDVRGFGETSALWSDYTARAVGRDALALLDHLGAGPAVILGDSFAADGGGITDVRLHCDRLTAVQLDLGDQFVGGDGAVE